MNTPTDYEARLGSEIVSVRHVQRVPASRDLFGRRCKPYWRAVCVFSDGRWAEDIDTRSLVLIETKGT